MGIRDTDYGNGPGSYPRASQKFSTQSLATGPEIPTACTLQSLSVVHTLQLQRKFFQDVLFVAKFGIDAKCCWAPPLIS